MSTTDETANEEEQVEQTEEAEEPAGEQHKAIAEACEGTDFETLLVYAGEHSEGTEPPGMILRGDPAYLAVGMYRLLDAFGQHAVNMEVVDPKQAEQHSHATIGMLVINEVLSGSDAANEEGESVH